MLVCCSLAPATPEAANSWISEPTAQQDDWEGRGGAGGRERERVAEGSWQFLRRKPWELMSLSRKDVWMRREMA